MTATPRENTEARHGAGAARRRLRPRGLAGKSISLALLTIVWILLNGELSGANLVAGLLIAIIVTVLFPMPAIVWPGRIRPWGVLCLLVTLIWDLARASVQLAILALSWRRLPRSGIVSVSLSSDADLYQVATGTLLSIVPGSVVVEARWRTRTLYMHIVDMSPDAVAVEQRAALRAELRVLRACGSAADMAQAQRRLNAWGRTESLDTSPRMLSEASPSALATPHEVLPSAKGTDWGEGTFAEEKTDNPLPASSCIAPAADTASKEKPCPL